MVQEGRVEIVLGGRVAGRREVAVEHRVGQRFEPHAVPDEDGHVPEDVGGDHPVSLARISGGRGGSIAAGHRSGGTGMGSIIVCGGGVVGLAMATMLGRDGHAVTVLEGDPDSGPDRPLEAWASWKRTGVAQFHQPHSFFARFRQVCDEELPGHTERLVAAGCTWVDFLATPPPTLSDRAPRPTDAALRLVTGRRPVVESVFSHAAQEQSGVTVRRGVRVAGFVPGRSAVLGVPHVAGVHTTGGEQLRADLVIDAMGRRSPSSDWLDQLGARPPLTESEDRGFAYYTRYYTGPDRPPILGRALTPMGTVSVLTLHSDNDTWSVTLFAQSGDTRLKALRHADAFSRVVGGCPRQAHWLDGTPLGGVVAMAGILDRYRRFVVDGEPVVTGFAAVGDAWACTNPSAGRGLSVGLVHAQLLRRTVRGYLDDPARFAQLWDEGTERVVTPFYRNQVAADRARTAEMTALRDGLVPQAAPSVMDRFAAAAARDADVFRALLETMLCTALPVDVLARPGMREKIERWGSEPAPPTPGPDRTRLLELIAG